MLMDVWHWTSLVVLLAYAGLRSIPDAYYQAAKIDSASRWAVFRFIQLPKMKRVLTIAVLLRFMDSFMVYTEPFVLTGGGPGNATTFLSIDLVKAALGEFNLGIAAAMSIIYFLMTLLVCWVFYTLMTKRTRRAEMAAAKKASRTSEAQQCKGSGRRARRCTVRALMRAARRGQLLWLVPTLYILFLMLPIYWLLNMSFKTTNEILGGFSMWPRKFTIASYVEILTNPIWYNGYISSITYVAYKHDDFGHGGTSGGIRFLALPVPRRQASVLLAADQPHGAAGGVRAAVLPALFGHQPVRHAMAVALAHCLFNIPLAVWILEGFMSGVPKEIDETAYIDGYSWPRFFVKIFMPMIASGIGVTAFFCFMFSWVELLLAKTLTSVAAKPIAAMMTRTASTSGYELGLLAAAGVLTIIPGAVVIYFVRNYIAKGFALGRV